MSEIIQNALKITDGQKVIYLNSKHRHDFVSYTFTNGAFVFTDGGLEYFRGGNSLKEIADNQKIEKYHLTKDNSWEEITNKLLWGHFENSDGSGEFKYSPIKELKLSHLFGVEKYLVDKGSQSIYLDVVRYWIGNI